MKQTFRTFLTLFLLAIGATASSAQTNDGGNSFDNVAGTFAWAVGNETEATTSETISKALSMSTVSVGTDLNVTTNGAYSALDIPAGAYMTYQPTTGNPGCVETDMIEYTVKMKKGVTLTPTSFEFDAVKEGTDGAYFSWSYTVDGVESAVTAYSDPKTQIRRNNNANPSAPLTHVENVTATAGQQVTLRLYISNVANNKKMSIGNIKINGIVNGEITPRSFKDFKIDFRTDPYTVTAPEGGLPEGVTVTGTFHDKQHGYTGAKVTFAVDGPVRITVGGCQFSNQATVTDAEGNVLATLNTNGAGCDTETSADHFVTWVYNNETPTTLTIDGGSYCPFIYAEACDLLPMVKVFYYNTDGNLLGSETVQGGSALKYAYTEKDVTVGEGMAFRGWFNSQQASAVKVAEGTTIQKETSLYAKATKIEIPDNTSRYIYELNKVYFYDEDHEAIDMTGSYHDAQHGWSFGAGQTIKVKVAGKAYISLGLCRYSADAQAVVTDEAGNEITTFNAKAADDADGSEYTIEYAGEATTLTITFAGTAYVHKVTVSNVVDFVKYDEATGYYTIAPNDVSSFLIALAAASGKDGSKIFLPNGVYDLGETVLTTISGKNISIIGESMDSTIIRNCPPVENEGIGTTATLLNTSENLYLQDLTLHNNLGYFKSGGAGRAVALQDKGKRTICKNVKLLSYQDTYYSNSNTQLYWETSEIHGVVDYICGGGDVYFNKCLLVNESRSASPKSGDVTITAPYTDASNTYGYVFNGCTVENLASKFNYGRAWGGVSRLAFLNTTLNQPGEIAKTRFTTGGMNVAADKFVEYNTMDKNGNVVSPASNVLTFTKGDTKNTYETILTAAQAAEYDLDKVFTDWTPDETAAQVTMSGVSKAANTITWTAVEGATAYAIFADGALEAIVDSKTTSYGINKTADKVEVRAANGRGGFGAAVLAGNSTGISEINSTENADNAIYNMQGIRVAKATKGLYIINGKKVIK